MGTDVARVRDRRPGARHDLQLPPLKPLAAVITGEDARGDVAAAWCAEDDRLVALAEDPLVAPLAEATSTGQSARPLSVST